MRLSVLEADGVRRNEVTFGADLLVAVWAPGPLEVAVAEYWAQKEARCFTGLLLPVSPRAVC